MLSLAIIDLRLEQSTVDRELALTAADLNAGSILGTIYYPPSLPKSDSWEHNQNKLWELLGLDLKQQQLLLLQLLLPTPQPLLPLLPYYCYYIGSFIITNITYKCKITVIKELGRSSVFYIYSFIFCKSKSGLNINFLHWLSGLGAYCKMQFWDVWDLLCHKMSGPWCVGLSVPQEYVIMVQSVQSTTTTTEVCRLWETSWLVWENQKLSVWGWKIQRETEPRTETERQKREEKFLDIVATNSKGREKTKLNNKVYSEAITMAK